jgi:hypothetical protein
MIAACLAVAAQSPAWAGGPSEAAMQQWIASTTPVEQHAQLAKLVGNWRIRQRDWREAGEPWNDATGTASFRKILGGRFVVQEITTSLQGHPYHGWGVIGYDRDAEKYVAAWMDDFGTSLLRLEGDPGAKQDGFAVSGYLGPAGDPRARWTMKQLWKDDDHQVIEWWGPDREGRPMKKVEVDYERVAS